MELVTPDIKYKDSFISALKDGFCFGSQLPAISVRGRQLKTTAVFWKISSHCHGKMMMSGINGIGLPFSCK